MYQFVDRVDPEALQAVTAWLYADMLKSGYTSVGEFHYLHHGPEGVAYDEGVGLVWKIHVIDLVRFWCRDGRPKTAIRDNGPLQGRILSRRQGRAGEGGNAPHRQKRYDAVS